MADQSQKPSETALEPFRDDQTAYTNESGAVHRVSPEMAAYIVKIRRIRPSITQAEIAQLVGVSQPTVSRWLAEFENDTVPETRKYLKGKALPAAMKLVEQKDDSDPRVSQGAAKAILALAGVQEGSAQVSVGVQVIVGSASQPAGPDPFETVTATIVESDS